MAVHGFGEYEDKSGETGLMCEDCIAMSLSAFSSKSRGEEGSS